MLLHVATIMAMSSWTSPVRRSRSKQDCSLLPVSSPHQHSSSSSSSSSKCGLIVTTLLLVSGLAAYYLLPMSRPAVAEAVVAEQPPEAAEQPLEAPAVEAAQPAATCEDKATQCKQWANSGECQRNPTFMHDECALSCGRCRLKKAAPAAEATVPASEAEPTTAVDATEALRLSKCRSWADSGECKKNPTYMKSKCSDVCAARDEAREKQRQQRAARQRGPQRLVSEREET